jgi:hypothetical protein
LELEVRPSADGIGVAKPNETNPVRRRPEAMMARSAARMRAHLDHFSGTLAAGLCRPARRFFGEAPYGIAARQSVRLSEIGRALEEPIALAKTETRLSRNLGRPGLGDHVGRAVLRQGCRKVGARTWPRRRTARTPPTHSPKRSLPRLRGRNRACRSAATTCWHWA